MPPTDLAAVTDVNVRMQAQVRAATLEDAAAIAKVRIDSWRATYRGMVPDAYLDAMDLEDSTSLWVRILSAPPGANRAVFVAESAAGIIGFSAGMMLDEAKFGCNSELTGIYLRTDAQRLGLGRQLVKAVAQECLARDATGMLLWVLSKNQIGRRFYEKLGGELLIEQPFTWDGLDLHEAGYGWRQLSALVESIPE